MIFTVLKIAIWVAGVAVIGHFVLNYFGYEINQEYWSGQKKVCEERLTECRKELVKGGVNGAKENCDFTCVDPKILIRKQSADDSQ